MRDEDFDELDEFAYAAKIAAVLGAVYALAWWFI